MKAELTQQEARVVDLLAQAWNEYLLLPVEHPSEAPEFCRPSIGARRWCSPGAVGGR